MQTKKYGTVPGIVLGRPGEWAIVEIYSQISSGFLRTSRPIDFAKSRADVNAKIAALESNKS